MNLYSPGPPGYLIYNFTTKRVLVRQNAKLVPPSSERPATQMNSLNMIINDDEERQEELNFQEADMKELMGITANKTFGAVVTQEQALASGADIVDTKMVRTKKLDGTLKSRLCGRGFTQKEGPSFWQTFCPTPMLPYILTTVAIAAQFDYDIFGADSTQAFLQPDIPSHMKGKIFVKLPKDIDIEGFQPGEIRELLKLIYGTKQSAKVWHDFITSVILEYKNEQGKYFPRARRTCVSFI